MPLKEQLAEYRAGWYQRVPAERQAIMQRHIDQLRSGAIARTMLKVGDHAPAIVLENAKGATVDVGTLLKKGTYKVAFNDETNELTISRGSKVLVKTTAKLEDYKKTTAAYAPEYKTRTESGALLLTSVNLGGAFAVIGDAGSSTSGMQ